MRQIDLLLAQLPVDVRSRIDVVSERLELLLDELVKKAASQWSELGHTEASFISHLGRQIPDGVELEQYLRSLKGSDLYLASACAEGNAEAIAAFEANYLRVVDAALAKIKTPVDRIDEIKQLLRERWFVRRQAEQPGIASYSGRGALQSWVRVSALREAYRYTEKRQRLAALETEQLARLTSPGDDPELQLVKLSCKAEFKAAFRDALASLSSRERNLLRHRYLDGMSVDQIGSLYRVHRATAARWVTRAHDALLAATRKNLQQQLDLSPSEYDSILRLIQSQIGLSIRAFLATDE